MESFLAAPVSCSAIRKSDAARTPRARPLGRSSTVGLPAPAQSAMWSKPMAKAPSTVTVPPKRTPPNIENCAAPLEQQAHHLQVILVPAHGDAVFGDAAEARHGALAEILAQGVDVAHRREGHARAVGRDAGLLGRQRLDLQAVDADHGVAVVHQVMREGEARRTQPDHQHGAAGRRAAGSGRRRLSGFQRVSSE